MLSSEKSKISEIERLHELFELASENAGIGIFYYDLVNHPGYFYAQDKTMNLIGAEINSNKLYTDDVWVSFMDQQKDKAIIEHVMEQFLGTWSGKYEFYDVEYPSPAFSPPKWLAAKAKVTKYDAEGKPLNMIGMLIDITKQKAQNDLIEKQKQELKSLAYKDQLTGLNNRLSFYEFIEKHTATILFIDLDGFKEINDVHGHEVGDLLLQKIGSKLQTEFSENKAGVYRIAGDEFVLTIDEKMSCLSVTDLTIKLMKSLSEPIVINEVEHLVTSSIGICLYDGQSKMTDVVKQSDMAMYIAKRNGKNRYVIANEFSMKEFCHKNPL